MGKRTGLVAVGFAAGVLLTALIKFPPSNSGEWASWVQAFGSIGAILGAFWVASIQNRSVRKEKQAAIFAVAHAAVEEARRFRSYLNAADPELELYLNYHKSIIDSYFGALSSCPVHELHSPIAVTAHLMLRDQFLFLRDSIEVCIAGPAKHPHWRAEHEELEGAYLSPENLSQLDVRTEGQRKVLRGNVEVHIEAIEKRYKEMAFALRPISTLIE